MLPKVDRLRIILDRLASAPRAATHAEAFDQLADVIDAVEDELTHIPRDPNAWQSDGRIYPPQLDARRDVDGRPDLAVGTLAPNEAGGRLVRRRRLRRRP